MTSQRTGNHELMRQQNLSGILHLLHEHAPISRSALARMSGLNKATVSSLVSELMQGRFVQEIGVDASGGAGRNSILLAIDPSRGFIVSAEVGVGFISVLCANFAVEVFWRERTQIAPNTSQDAIVGELLSLLGVAIEQGKSGVGELLGLTVSVPGLVDRADGTVLFAPNMGWSDVPIGAILCDSFQTLISVDNEANLATLGEQVFGVAAGHDEVLYISVGVGLGGGIVHGGELLRGANGFAGEFGHMSMDPNGEPCSCGSRGCWETQVSQSALFRRLRADIAAGRPSSLRAGDGRAIETLTVPLVVEAARCGDAVSLDAFRSIGRFLGIGIASLVNVANPTLVVFGGILSQASEFILPAAREELRSRVIAWDRRNTQIVVARYGSDAALMGGVARIHKAILAAPAADGARARSTGGTTNGPLLR